MKIYSFLSQLASLRAIVVFFVLAKQSRWKHFQRIIDWDCFALILKTTMARNDNIEKNVLGERRGQSAIEYLLLLTLVGIIVIAAFSKLQGVKDSSGKYFLKAAASIMGRPLDSLDGKWCEWGECISDVQKRVCDCPAPIGSGAICAGSAEQPCIVPGGSGFLIDPDSVPSDDDDGDGAADDGTGDDGTDDDY